MKTLAEMIAVMQAAEAKKPIYSKSLEDVQFGWMFDPKPDWNWAYYDYDIASDPPQPKRVPLEAKDIKPGMVFKLSHLDGDQWMTPLLVGSDGIRFDLPATKFMDWKALMNEAMWSTDAVNWQPCSKEA